MYKAAWNAQFADLLGIGVGVRLVSPSNIDGMNTDHTVEAFKQNPELFSV